MIDLYELAIARKLSGGGGGGGGATPIIITPYDNTAPNETEVVAAYMSGTPIFVNESDEYYSNIGLVTVVSEDLTEHQITIGAYSGTYIYNSENGWVTY